MAGKKFLSPKHCMNGEQRETLEMYIKSFSSDPNQSGFLIKIGELLIQDNMETSLTEMKFWSEQLSERFPKHYITLDLKEKLHELITNELSEGSSLYKSATSSFLEESLVNSSNIHHFQPYSDNSSFIEASLEAAGNLLKTGLNSVQLRDNHVNSNLDLELQILAAKQKVIVENILSQQKASINQNKYLQESLNELLKSLTDLKLKKSEGISSSTRNFSENQRNQAHYSRENSETLAHPLTKQSNFNFPSFSHLHTQYLSGVYHGVLHQSLINQHLLERSRCQIMNNSNINIPFWKCSYCFFKNNAGSLNCSGCSAPVKSFVRAPLNQSLASHPAVSFKPDLKPWICVFCNFHNLPVNNSCAYCFRRKEDSTPQDLNSQNTISASEKNQHNKTTKMDRNRLTAFRNNDQFHLSIPTTPGINDASPIISNSNTFFNTKTLENSNSSAWMLPQNNWPKTQLQNLPATSTFTFGASTPQIEKNSDLNAGIGSYSFKIDPKVKYFNGMSKLISEENAVSKFCQRGRMYRINLELKDWEEIGAGDMKILLDPVHKTYRLFLCHEKTLNIICNSPISTQTDFRPLKLSPSIGWMWIGLNFFDPIFDAQMEIMAIKFRNKEVAEQFKIVIDQAKEDTEKCVGKKELIKDLSMDPWLKYLDDIDQKYSLVLEKPVTFDYFDNSYVFQSLGNGFLRIVYDLDSLIVRIIFENIDSGVVCNTLICMESIIQVDGLECTYTSIEDSPEFAMMKIFKAKFSSVEDVNEMFLNFQDGLEFAKHALITEDAFCEDKSLPKN